MAKFRVVPLLWVVFICILSLPGCSGKKTVTITLSPTTTPTINQGQTQAITAAVTNDSSNSGVTWTLGTSEVGTLINSTPTSVTYQAPPTLTVNTTVTVTATSVVDTSITASISITVDALLAISTGSLPFATKGVPYFGVVSATGSAGPFTWALSAGNLPAGLAMSSSTTDSVTISGTPAATGTSKFTIEVTAGGSSVDQKLSIAVNPPPPLAIATNSLPEGTVGVAYNQTLQATSGAPPYKWSRTTGSLPAGLSLGTNGAISGVPTAAGTSSFTVQVLDSTTPTPQTATTSLSITINPSTASNSRLNGNYAFLVSGFEAQAPFVAAGSFVANGNGDLANGVMDTNTPGSLQTGLGFNGKYLLGSNDLGTMTFNITSGGAGSRSFALALMADGNAKLIEFDDVTGNGTRASGVLMKQDTTAFSDQAITGNFAFGFIGSDAVGSRYGLAGQCQADGGGNLNAGVLDSDDGNAGPTTNVSFTGAYSIPAVSAPAMPSGRGTASISVAGQGTTNYSFYVVSTSDLLVMEIDQVAGQGSPIVSGSILKQAGAGSFGSSSLNGTSVFETTGLNTSGGNTAVSQLGLFITDGSGNLSTSSDLNAGGALSQPVSSGTYNVATNGRVTLANSGIGSSQPVIYLVSEGTGFILGTDATVAYGFLESQSKPQLGLFTTASVSGTYAGGTIAPVQSSASHQVDIAAGNGAGGLSFTTDISSSSGLIQNQSSSNTYSLVANGRGVVPANGSPTEIFYLVSPTEFFWVSTDASARVEMFQQ
ncbi:MAG: putative Ig domain-containing protein [Terriglobales bacterium]